MKNAIKILFICLLGPVTAHSQTGTHGGDPNETAEFLGNNGEHLQSWYQVKTDLISGFNTDRYTELDLMGINPTLFKTKNLEVLNGTSVEFREEKIIINGIRRPCKNFKDSEEKPHIQCDTSFYATEMKNYTSETQYKLISHEYFSAAGFEPNSYGLSDYPFSSQVSDSLSQVIVKKWAVRNGTRPVFVCKSTLKYKLFFGVHNERYDFYYIDMQSNRVVGAYALNLEPSAHDFEEAAIHQMDSSKGQKHEDEFRKTFEYSINNFESNINYTVIEMTSPAFDEKSHFYKSKLTLSYGSGFVLGNIEYTNNSSVFGPQTEALKCYAISLK